MIVVRYVPISGKIFKVGKLPTLMQRGLIAKLGGALLVIGAIGLGSVYVPVSVNTKVSSEVRKDIATVVGKSYRKTNSGETPTVVTIGYGLNQIYWIDHKPYTNLELHDTIEIFVSPQYRVTKNLWGNILKEEQIPELALTGYMPPKK